MCTIIQVYSGPQNGLFIECLTISSDKYVWNINILILDRTRDLHTRVNFLHLKIVAFFRVNFLYSRLFSHSIRVNLSRILILNTLITQDFL